VTSPSTHGAERTETDAELRNQLSNLQALLVLSMLMTERGDEHHIVHLLATSVPSLGPCRLEGVHLIGRGWQGTGDADIAPEWRADVDTQLAVLGAAGGALAVVHASWAWAFPLRSFEGNFGFLVVTAADEPTAAEQFLLRGLAQQAGIAMANARLHSRERSTAQELRDANDSLAETVAALRLSTRIHDRLTQAAVEGAGEEGIAEAVHELTGYPVVVEDRHGNLRAWAGPDRPATYPKDPADRRERLLRDALAAVQPIRHGGHLLAVARPGDDVLGLLALVDPDGTAGEQEQVALEHGATVLAVELARQRSLAEAELRVRRDLVEELLSGVDEAGALGRARALGYDLERTHRVVVVECGETRRGADAVFHAVRRAAAAMGAGSLLVARGGAVVVLADADVSWADFRTAVQTEVGGGRCRVGVGGACDRPADFPRSLREAQLALSMQETSGGADQASVFDQLGVYRVLAGVEDRSSVERFVDDWLGALLAYDAKKKSELAPTLARYLECGGSYDATAHALAIHRSTLKYRLQRIREISGHDLGDPDTLFNLQLASRAWSTLLALRRTQ
jgi:sugar diacid utilization regulator